MFTIKDPKNQKLINVNSSSIIDLKAELFRKREQIAQQKNITETKKDIKNNDNILYAESINKNTSLPKRVLDSLKQLENNNKRPKQCFKKESDINKPKDEDEERAIQQSRMNLERKAKLYEQMRKGLVKIDNDDENILVDFQQKHSVFNECESDDDDLVEYVDQFGRTRMVTSKEFDQLEKERIETEQKANDKSESDSEPEGDKKPSLNIHYQHVREGEIRDHGVAFYSFSTDEQVRIKQMEMMKQLRKETEFSKEKKQRIQEKRKQMLRARLEKIAARKGLTLPEEPEEEEKEDEDIKLEPAKLAPDRPKSNGPREWDIGKEGVSFDRPLKLKQSPFYSQQKYQEKLRQERNPDFAPPQTYFNENPSKKIEHFIHSKSNSTKDSFKSDSNPISFIAEKISEIRKKI